MADETTVALNRRARHDFTIDETFEAGIVLTGTEIKSLRAGKANLSDAYARIEHGEAWLVGAHIAPFEGGNRYNHEPKRTRKLLLHRSEIDELLGRTKAKGQTIVPLRLYISRAGPGQGRARARQGQAAPRPAARHRRARRAPRRRPRAGRRAARTVAVAPVPARLRIGPVIEAVDAHAAGEPGRVIVGGVEGVPGSSMFEAMEWLQANRDDLRLRMLREPRGYPAANCNLILQADRSGGRRRVRDHGTGRVPRDVRHEHDVRRDRPARDRDAADGRAGHRADPRGPGRAHPRPGGLLGRQGHRRHVPQRARLRDAPRGAGRGAARWARSSSTSRTAGCSTSSPRREPFGLRLTPDEGADIVRITEMIKAAANEQLPVVHPEQPGFSGITIGQLSGPAHDPANSRRNVVTVSTGTLDWERPATWTGAIDRSPCGTGTSARMAVLHAKGELGVGDAFRHEGILGTVFTGRVVEETHDRAVPGDRSDDHRPGLDHRLRQLRRRSDRSVPRRLHDRGHLGVGRAGRCRARPARTGPCRRLPADRAPQPADRAGHARRLGHRARGDLGRARPGIEDDADRGDAPRTAAARS